MTDDVWYVCPCGWEGRDPEWVPLENDEHEMVPVCPNRYCSMRLEDDCGDECSYRRDGK